MAATLADLYGFGLTPAQQDAQKSKAIAAAYRLRRRMLGLRRAVEKPARPPRCRRLGYDGMDDSTEEDEDTFDDDDGPPVPPDDDPVTAYPTLPPGSDMKDLLDTLVCDEVMEPPSDNDALPPPDSFTRL